MAMPLGGSSNATRAPFQLCPAGMQQAVCCDIIDHGIVTVPGFRGQPAKRMHKGTIRWQSIHKMPDGRPYIVQRRFTISAHTKATIRSFLAGWRGQPMSDEQARTFDLEKLIGINAMLVVTHVNKPAKGGIFQEVMMAAPVPRGTPRLVVSPDYVRWKDKPENQPGYKPPAEGSQPAAAAAADAGGAQDPHPSEWDSVDELPPGEAEPGATADEPEF